MRALTALLCAALAAGCSEAVKPVALDTKNDQCGTCRMVVSAQKTASQVVAPYQEPKFFDDLGCLDRFLASSPLPNGARVFVADHRTGEWVDAASATYAKAGSGAGAMGSPFVAYASPASRDADREVAGAAATAAAALPSLGKLGGTR
jgi:copper chaperone NosL